LVEFTDFIENPAYIDENQYPGAFVTALTPIAILVTDTHTYVLSKDTVNFPDNNAFTITNDTILSNQSFDFEIKNQYTLLIEVTDKFGTVYLDTFTVYINGLIEFTDFVANPVDFDENQDVGLLVTQFVPLGVLPIDTHTYILSADLVNFPDNNAFSITTDSLMSNWNYDFETQSIYTLLIEVRDRFNTMYLDTFIININDRVEFTDFIENPTSFDENQVVGLLVTTLTPIAILATDTHTYKLSTDTVNFPDNNAFTLNTDSLISNWNYDFETQSVYTLLIEVRDRFDTMYLDTFIVNINDIDEFEYFEEDPFYFEENQIVGTMVSVLVPVGSLFGEKLTYSLSTDTIYFSDDSAFSIVEDELLSAEVYNYETQNEYNLLVEIRNEFGTLYLDTLLVIIIDLIEFDDLKVTNFITPNEDGKNDYFLIPNPELFSDYTLRIFNDNGNEVYLQEGDYNNDWNGLTTSGEELPSATYYYTFTQKVRSITSL
jgi:gliding motility-associated-like protein